MNSWSVGQPSVGQWVNYFLPCLVFLSYIIPLFVNIVYYISIECYFNPIYRRITETMSKCNRKIYRKSVFYIL